MGKELEGHFSVDATINSRPVGIERFFKPFVTGMTEEETERAARERAEQERISVEAEGKQFFIKYSEVYPNHQTSFPIESEVSLKL
ncbi:MAG: hypothetical protein Q7R43_02780 [Candidatus Daviesbacteria bacterium]|nr:hypothetical protein [Candidatus Daviesbacteria bacterium]